MLTFIDDFSRCTWLYSLKYKFDAFEAFVKKQSGLSIQ